MKVPPQVFEAPNLTPPTRPTLSPEPLAAGIWPIIGTELATYGAVLPIARQIGLTALGTLHERISVTFASAIAGRDSQGWGNWAWGRASWARRRSALAAGDHYRLRMQNASDDIASNPKLQEAMVGELQRIAGQCDGVRCDMAMLVLPEVFQRTWGIAAELSGERPSVRCAASIPLPVDGRGLLGHGMDAAAGRIRLRLRQAPV
jgi:hypothetical protein